MHDGRDGITRTELTDVIDAVTGAYTVEDARGGPGLPALASDVEHQNDG